MARKHIRFCAKTQAPLIHHFACKIGKKIKTAHYNGVNFDVYGYVICDKTHTVTFEVSEA